MDGFALRAADLGPEPALLTVAQRIAAGQIGKPLDAGDAARIFTGAPLPEGADAVVMQENCEVINGKVKILQNVVSGENLRRAGEDIKAGTTLLRAGHRFLPQDVGLAASTGVTELSVKRKLRVALMTTGDELVFPGSELKPGQIYNSNYYSLLTLLRELSCEVIQFGIIKDDFQKTKDVLLKATEKADCIISTGGVSVGEEDHIKAAVDALGHLDLWKLAIKPGKPFASGKVGTTQFFGLPGNPVSAFVTFLLLVKPCLLQMIGGESSQPRGFFVLSDFSSAESGERQEYIRVSLLRTKDGEVRVKPFENQSSGIGTSLSSAQGLAIIPPFSVVSPGDVLEFIPFTELLG
tara:strand:- start:299 stop:1351 length:1053 start_codon:yes stop_codon:yes gene_type:complete